MRLSNVPSWQYLLRDVLELYYMGSAGGSAKIRTHMAEVRRALGKVFEDDPEIDYGPAKLLPVCEHLDRAISSSTGLRTAKVARSLESVRGLLNWKYGYERVPRGLTRKYGYTEILGPNGPVVSERIIIGCVLFAPKTTYPAHSHKGRKGAHRNFCQWRRVGDRL